MYLFKKLLDFYINSSIHVALAITSLCCVTVFEHDLCKHITYPSCLFFGSILGYNFLKYWTVFIQKKFYSINFYLIGVISFLSVLGFYFFFKRLIFGLQIQLFFSFFLVLVYPFLRKYGIVKMFWVSFVVAYVSAFIYLIKSPIFIGNLALEFLSRFVFVSAIMVPFEIYDSKNDLVSLNTLPQKYGIDYTKKLGYLFTILFLLLEFLKQNTSFQNFKVDVIIAIFLLFSIRLSSIDRSKYYTGFWVESIPILWWLLLVVSS